MKIRIVHIMTVALALGFLAGCSAPVRIFTEADPSGEFGNYSTYTFMDFTEGNKKTISQVELEKIRTAFARELESRGLEYVQGKSDLAVKIVVYHRNTSDFYPSYPGYNYPYRYPYSPTIYHHMERAITLDIFDNSSGKHIWHGAAVGELTYDSKRRLEELPQIAAKMFKNYPVARKDTAEG